MLSIFKPSFTYSSNVLPIELIEARGVVEKVGDIKRLVVGASRELKGEWIRSLTWLERGAGISERGKRQIKGIETSVHTVWIERKD